MDHEAIWQQLEERNTKMCLVAGQIMRNGVDVPDEDEAMDKDGAKEDGEEAEDDEDEEEEEDVEDSDESEPFDESVEPYFDTLADDSSDQASDAEGQADEEKGPSLDNIDELPKARNGTK
jgi:hypothetical protein